MEYSIKNLIDAAGSGTIYDAAIKNHGEQSGKSADDVIAQMRETLAVMRTSIEDGMKPGLHSISGLTGGQGQVLHKGTLAGKTCGGSVLGIAMSRALAIAESNAAMGKIVAAPTAGACGILPAALLTVAEEKNIDDESIINALFTAAAIGRVIANRAGISGAQAGCQAETGSAAAMAAAALCEMLGASKEAAASACGFALMATMGLVCDPVGGLVEIPCIYRNASGVSIAFSSADMALSGITCPLPADEIIDAMAQVGEQMPVALRETGLGGCAACPTAIKMAESLHQAL